MSILYRNVRFALFAKTSIVQARMVHRTLFVTLLNSRSPPDTFTWFLLHHLRTVGVMSDKSLHITTYKSICFCSPWRDGQIGTRWFIDVSRRIQSNTDKLDRLMDGYFMDYLQLHLLLISGAIVFL